MTWTTRSLPAILLMSGFPKMEVIIESLRIGLKSRNKNKSLRNY
jgi:hypothetical protein